MNARSSYVRFAQRNAEGKGPAALKPEANARASKPKAKGLTAPKPEANARASKPKAKAGG